MRGAGGGSGPLLCWRVRVRFVVSRRWGWNPNGAGRAGGCAAVRTRSVLSAESVPSRARTAPTSATHRMRCSGSSPMTMLRT